MKIKSVSISGMHNVTNKTYMFNDVNYLHGHNGAGKSTILQAIQLAILGYIPGTAKQVSSIFQHASGPEMKIRVQFDDGRAIERKWNVKGRSIETSLAGDFDADSILGIIGDLELPIFNFNELVNMTANKLKDWFINFLPSAAMDIHWEDELKNSLGDLAIMDLTVLSDTLDEIKSNSELGALELIQVLNASLKDKQSFLKTELKKAEGTIQSLIYYDDADLIGDAAYLDGEVQKAQTEISRLTHEKEKLIQATQIIQSNNNIRRQLETAQQPEGNVDDLKDEYDSLSAKIPQIETKIDDLETREADLTLKIYAIDGDIKAKSGIIQSQGICPYTNTSCNSIVEMVEQFKSEVADLNAQRTELVNEVTALKQQAADERNGFKQLQQQMNLINLKISTARSAQNTIDRLNAAIVAEPNIADFQEMTWYADEIARLNQRITKIQANKQYNALIDKLTADKYRIENTIEVYKCWIKLTDPNGLQTKVMDGPFKALAEEMDSYLSIMFSGDVHCKFNLEQKTNSFSFGISRCGRYIPYDLLSSGEKTMYTLAMMLCIINKSSASLKLLIVDDMLDHLDDTRADEVFAALGKITDTQVIIAGVKDSVNAKTYTIEVQ